MTAPTTWTPEEDAELTRLWADPTLSASAIGERMGRSKNSIVGRTHRLHLPARPSPIGKSVAAFKAPTPKRMPAVVATAPEPATVFQPRSSGSCQWIEGSGPPWRFCDAPTERGRSWCACHLSRVFVQRREAA